MPDQKSNARPGAKKKAPPKRSLAQQAEDFIRDMKRDALGWIKHLDKFRDIIKNNYELGRNHLQRGNLNDAIMRFRFVVWLEPKHADAWYYLGCSYMANGKEKSARAAFARALALKPGNEETEYMMAIAGGKMLAGNDMPKKIPQMLMRDYFDGLAPTYTQDQLETQKYEGHTLLCETIRTQLVKGRIDHTILDLGVGTGLCGPLLRDVAAHITGVDISGAMLAEAMKLQDASGQKTYDALVKRDLFEFLCDAPDASYDVVMAATVLSYVSDVPAVFKQVSRVLKPGGVFAFTADRTDGESVLFDAAEARFRFSLPYLEELADDTGFTVAKGKEAGIYPDYVAWLCVLTK